MHKLLYIISILSVGLCKGQKFFSPEIPIKASNISAYIPSGYILFDSVSGDLNMDAKTDAVLVIQSVDSMWLNNEEEIIDSVKTKPRILIILFEDSVSGGYILHSKNDRFIPYRHVENMDEPFEDIRISDGCLNINFRHFMHSGSWYTSTYQYQFRLIEEEFLLIAADYYSKHRASGDYDRYEYDFLKNIRIHTKGNISRRRKNVQRSQPGFKSLKKLTEFTAPMTWKVDDDVYL